MNCKLVDTTSRIGILDEKVMAEAKARQQMLTKPAGSLGSLEEISIHIAGIQGTVKPDLTNKVVFTLAGDHGVVAEGISAYPQEVTPQMVYNFIRGGAAINVLARHVGARVVIADLGVVTVLNPQAGIVIKKVGYGTKNLACGPAMTHEQAVESIEAGIEIFEAELPKGMQIAATGEMGIGNTTPSAAIVAAITGLQAEAVTGRGTGVSESGYAAKVNAVKKGLAVNQPDPCNAIDVLAKVGGFEIGGLAGIILAAAAHRVPVVIDGFISGAAALIAAGVEPKAKQFMLAGHMSVEPGHRVIMNHLGLKPLLDLNLRLGEGTGAALAMTIIESAVKILNEMATFGEAGVSEAT